MLTIPDVHGLCGTVFVVEVVLPDHGPMGNPETPRRPVQQVNSSCRLSDGDSLYPIDESRHLLPELGLHTV